MTDSVVTGRPIPAATWERRYRDGALEHLASRDELGHYLIVAGYICHSFRASAILDVGCGTGRLQTLLDPTSFRRYLGIDISERAITRARCHAGDKSRFEVIDFDDWAPPDSFTVIVFCESLNYARNPTETLARYARALEPGGGIIVSLFRHRHHSRIWGHLEQRFPVADATTVINRRGRAWDVKLLHPPALSG